MQTMKESLTEIFYTIKNAWPQLSGVALAIFIRYACFIYDGDARKNKWAECLLCGALSWAVISGAEFIGIPNGASGMIGGAIGFLGVEKIRDIAHRIISKRLGDK
ncbi:phage holin, lambda family [Arsenophonus apicola]|uniref:Phage holin, lambda family n=1 Tax=Arsenophonus apicola TaxID=2879119 RepID=A0ABY8P5B0_9GAMM|nr:phage holin, lambda family [Arsenophonus apicola]WGO84678.1 phage holin, lambda family [Arsenophonus apicola]